MAYAGLSRTRRRWLHGQVARALEQVHIADLDRVAGVIAGHYEAARLPAQAIAYYDRAAAAARGVYAHHEALAALEKASSLLDALPDQGTRRELEAHLLEEIGDLRELLTQHIPARDAYVAALACAPHVDTVAQARLHRKIGKTLENERADYDPGSCAIRDGRSAVGHAGRRRRNRLVGRVVSGSARAPDPTVLVGAA